MYNNFIQLRLLMIVGTKTPSRDVKMATISFVYEGIGIKFCMWVPVSTMITMK